MKITPFLAALAALPLLSGCGRSDAEATAGAAASPSRPQELANALPRGRGGVSGFLSGRGLPPCPRVAMLGDAVDLTRFRAGTVPDLATMEVDARLVGVQARCEYAPRNAGVDITLFVQVAAERGPAAAGRAVQVPYFIAVTERDESRILNRVADAVTIAFPNNSNTTAVTGEEMLVRLPGDPNVSATRQILIGFVLSPDEVALNRRRGPRT